MKVDSADRQNGMPEKIVSPSKTGKDRFSMLLNEHLSETHPTGNPPAQIARLRGGSAAKYPDHRIHLGMITEATPTVSNLLITHPSYVKDTWRIVHSDRNKDKPYTEIRPGTHIYMDPETLEIYWKRDEFHLSAAQKKDGALSLKASEIESTAGGSPEKADEWIDLGVISRYLPTVSHLLKQHPDYRETVYPIIHSPINRDKPYRTIHTGARVFLNPKTLEIVWDHENGENTTRVMAHTQSAAGPEAPRPVLDAPDVFSENLVRSVSHFVGRPYEEMDCFELVVRGLDKMGINYNRRGGLYDQLVGRAVARGLPENAYLNGEGLIEASGARIYMKSMPDIKDPEAQAHQVYQEMEPLLNKGFILSFSTQTRGHTGIVSRKDRLWTYINSGNLDNTLGTRKNPKGVGEEILAEEIKNWVILAAKNRQSLKITLGRLDSQKLPGAET